MSEEEDKVEEEEATAAPKVTDEDESSDDEDEGADGAEDSEAGDEDEDDDEESDEESEEDEPKASSVDEMLGKESEKPKKKKKKKTGRKKKAPKSTAGQRLAAAKAAKAAKKAAARGKQAELVEDEAAARADMAAGWLERNRGMIMAAAMAVLVAMGGYFAWEAYSNTQAGEASALLWDATQTLNAPVGEEDPLGAQEDDEDDAEEERYESIGERADAAIAKLDSLLSDYGSTDLAPWAQVLRGRALYQKGEHDSAREAFSTALADGGADVRPRALEGIAFTYEAEESWDEAISRFEELRSDDDPSLSILADYHIARVHIARDNEEEAKEKLQAVLNALQEEDAPELGFVRDQAELRLMAIDSSLVQRSTPDQDEMRRLIEQLQRQQAEGG